MFLFPLFKWNESYSLSFNERKLQFTTVNYSMLSMFVS